MDHPVRTDAAGAVRGADAGGCGRLRSTELRAGSDGAYRSSGRGSNHRRHGGASGGMDGLRMLREYTAVATIKIDIPIRAMDERRAELESRLAVDELRLLLMRAGASGVTVSGIGEPAETTKKRTANFDEMQCV